MLDKYKDKNEFYSLVGIKCYSYVPSLLLFLAIMTINQKKLKKEFIVLVQLNHQQRLLLKILSKLI
ncbi:hypothetical protein [Spiroplasma endosymbiont of Tipula paludosa]|uniref:hypothetical protein n=1 Tax=Spiroplasma endosymbiont of Tipula paludosa TaxID=3066295 RepID=UPI0035C8D083